MKILAGNLKGENINWHCQCCGAIFDLESKEDFYIIGWIHRPDDAMNCNTNILIPEYGIKCPVCDSVFELGFDPADCGENLRRSGCRYPYEHTIFNRKDWKERYKTDPKIKNR